MITSLCGDIDFRSDNISIETIKKLYESDFPYLGITEEGKKVLYGVEQINDKIVLSLKLPRTKKTEKLS